MASHSELRIVRLVFADIIRAARNGPSGRVVLADLNVQTFAAIDDY